MSAKPELEPELVAGLNGVRIGLIGFDSSETERIQRVLDRAGAQAVLREFELKSIEERLACDALVVNACRMAPKAAPRSPKDVPVVFISPRPGMRFLANLNTGPADFLVAPWEVEEILMRVYRLVVNRVRASEEARLHAESEKPARVPIVDDDLRVGALVADALRQVKIDSEFARSGRIALESMRKSVPAAIVLDLNRT